MVERTRAFEWSSTALGPIETWPDVLTITVNMLLACPHPMFLWWGKDLIQFYNDAYRQSLRDDKHPSALGQKGSDCWPEIWDIIRPQIEEVMEQGKAIWKENQLIPIFRDGILEDVYWTYSYSPIRDPAGHIGGTLVTCSETTSKQIAERALRQELTRLADLFRQAPAFFAVLRGPHHIFERINSLYQQLLGPRDLIGKSVREAVPEVEAQGFIDILDTVYRTGEPFIGRGTPIQLAHGSDGILRQRFLDFVYQPALDADGSVSGIIVLGVDVTESKRSQQMAIQTEKLVAVGRLASSIAHEIINPLEAVTNLIYLARATADKLETVQYLQTAETELRRASAIPSQTLRFHRQSTKAELTTAKELMDETLTIFQSRMANSRVQLLRRERTPRPILCFSGEIRQVLSNLIGNAIDAMNATGGLLYVRSREGTNFLTGNSGIFFTIADTGSGMSREVVSRIFEAFFTTKGASGTGLGLWISWDIVERHGGTLRVKSSQRAGHHGTVFQLFLLC